VNDGICRDLYVIHLIATPFRVPYRGGGSVICSRHAAEYLIYLRTSKKTQMPQSERATYINRAAAAAATTTTTPPLWF